MWKHQLHKSSIPDTTKLKKPLGLKLATLFWCLVLYQHVMVYSHAVNVLQNISKIPPHIRLYLLFFCSASNCQFIRLICGKFFCSCSLGSNFTRQNAVMFRNTEIIMNFIVNIERTTLRWRVDRRCWWPFTASPSKCRKTAVKVCFRHREGVVPKSRFLPNGPMKLLHLPHGAPTCVPPSIARTKASPTVVQIQKKLGKVKQWIGTPETLWIK